MNDVGFKVSPEIEKLILKFSGKDGLRVHKEAGNIVIGRTDPAEREKHYEKKYIQEIQSHTASINETTVWIKRSTWLLGFITLSVAVNMALVFVLVLITTK